MNILITSPRAPIVLEWIKIARKGNHRIALSDALRYPLAKFASTEAVYHRIPAPRLAFEDYCLAMNKLIDWADIVIPTCEDIFYLAKIPLSSEARQKCWTPETELLFALHHKLNVFDYLPEVAGVKHPETRLINHHQDIIFNEDKTILKPVFSRFGRSVVREVTPSNTQALSITPAYPWVQQQQINGLGLCNYAICEHGKVLAHSVYRPRYLLNHAAATYFEPLIDERCERFIQAFAQRNCYHGQVAFDFMDDGIDLWVLECNPRATSGLHILGDSLMLDADGKLCQTGANHQKPLRISVTLPLLFGISAIQSCTWKPLWQDYHRADDAIQSIPTYAHFLALGEMLWRKWRYAKSLTSASTFDIEYDGSQDD
ncbi:carbamoyl-phosphate synthase large subunit [Conchiformibius steedae]|uniref:Carbamoyl-phosphate synthase large subunit n=1 Tax=Conchiformibius steedae TaxID=153493 RepID=A0A3P2A3G8_9NEIS|nr:carbamoyl-phosphate synthase large subunit [Conchiformibius steedae]RRD89982.1 carbamoyl-phosphate synthase large subunit [Conchiformibius steedae]